MLDDIVASLHAGGWLVREPLIARFDVRDRRRHIM